MKEYRMREDIKEYLDYLEDGEETEICKKISRIRKYIEDILLECEIYKEMIKQWR